MKELTDEQVKIITEALEKATHKEFEKCAATVCEQLAEALKILKGV